MLTLVGLHQAQLSHSRWRRSLGEGCTPAFILSRYGVKDVGGICTKTHTWNFDPVEWPFTRWFQHAGYELTFQVGFLRTMVRLNPDICSFVHRPHSGRSECGRSSITRLPLDAPFRTSSVKLGGFISAVVRQSEEEASFRARHLLTAELAPVTRPSGGCWQTPLAPPPLPPRPRTSVSAVRRCRHSQTTSRVVPSSSVRLPLRPPCPMRSAAERQG